jgi:hypothetical protein
MSIFDRLSPKDLELLSAYLDGECSTRDAARLDARLRSEPGLRQALEQLRATAGLLRALPEVKPPRSFALQPDMVGLKPRRAQPRLRLATALATAAFAVLLGLDALTSFVMPQAGSAPADDVREMAVLEEQPAEAPMMAAEPQAAIAEEEAIPDEAQDSFEAQPTEWLQLTPTPEMQALPPVGENAERAEGMFDEGEHVLGAALKVGGKQSGLDAADIQEPELPYDQDAAGTDAAPDRGHGILDWPLWRIGLRAVEVTLGLVALVLVGAMLWKKFR